MDKDNKKIVPFKCSGFAGDLIWYLAGIKHVVENRESKADIYLWLDRPGSAYPGAIHPNGGVMINQKTFDMLKPLLEAQPYVNEVKPWKGEATIDLDIIRQMKVGMPYGNLAHWVAFKYPDMMADLSKPWIHNTISGELTHTIRKYILINRTARHQNPYVSYHFLKEYKDHLMFTGLPEEHEQFCKEWELDIPLLKVDNFWQLATAIHECKFFVGNQSMCFGIAEAVKVPRLLEVWDLAPNIHPVGENAFYFLYQNALIERFKFLDNL